MFVRFMLILLLSNLMTSLAMAAQVSSESCILVQNHPSVTYGDIAINLGRRLSVRPGKITEHNDSFLIQAPDTVKESLLGLQALDVSIDGRDVAVNFVSQDRQAGAGVNEPKLSQGYKVYALVDLTQVTANKNNKDSFEGRCGDRTEKIEEEPYEDRVTGLIATPVDDSEKALRKRIENALAKELKSQTNCFEIRVTWEANWLKVPFPDKKYVAPALAQSPLIITNSHSEIRLLIRPMPEGNVWIKSAVSSANSHQSVTKSSTPPNVTFSSSSSSNFTQQDAPKNTSITVSVPQKCTLGEVYKLVGLELAQLPSVVLEAVIKGEISIEIDALKKHQLLTQGSTTIPDQARFSKNRIVIFLDE